MVFTGCIHREALWLLYDEAARQIDKTRDNSLNTQFYLKIKAAVFEACYTALLDHRNNKRRILTVSAPPGTGKTTFSLAFIVAMTRYTEQNLDVPYGCAFITDRTKRADDVYRELQALLPSKVAIWTDEHKELFSREALRQYPVIVVNNQFYTGANGKHARNVNNRGHYPGRALTIIDERPQEVEPVEITLAEAQKVRETLQETHPEAKGYTDSLFKFMERYSYEPRNHIYLPDALSDQLAWFTTSAAARLATLKIPNIDRLFGFAKTLVQGTGFVVSESKHVRYIGYSSKLTVNLSAGTVLLDATADIDGVSPIVPWRVTVEAPQADYGNLDIVHVPQHTTKHLKSYFGTARNQRAYAKWMEQVILEHMSPGQKGLVICKKTLIDQEKVPSWPEGDERFHDPDIYTTKYGWELEGRYLCVVHWGSGIGSNVWRDADTVFLCDEFHLPRRVAIANVQGLREHQVTEGDLASMTTLNSRAPAVDIYALGHRLRWIKQMALRGHARCYDEHGKCGKQRLVVACDLETFMANVPQLFPGATVRIAGDREHASWKDKILVALNRAQGDVMTTKELSKILRREWRLVSPKLLTPEFEGVLQNQGWMYVRKRGRGGARFEQVKTERGVKDVKGVKVPEEAVAVL